MGCMYSSADRSDRSSRTFRVYNVDENGDELNSGKIEVTDVDLILHQKGKDPIHWPLRCLRRYGCDQELFSFESGRRCPTGPGIYAFKCRRAESLFAAVQECIQRAGQQDELGANQAFDHNIHNSRPSSVIEMQQVNGFVVQPGSLQTNALTRDINYINVDTNVDADHQYVNVNTGGANGSRPRSLPNGGMDSVNAESVLIDFLHNPKLQQDSDYNRNSAGLQYIRLDLPESAEDECEEASVIASQNANHVRTHSEPDVDGGDDHGLPNIELDETINCDVFDDSPYDASNQRDYMNVAADGIRMSNGNPVQLRQPKNADHNYLNISHPISASNSSNVPSSAPPPQGPGRLNYIEVANLTNGTGTTTPTSPVSYNSYPAESPSKRTDSYTVIDFAKTQALSNSSRVMSDAAGEGIRKTRHNSTITS
ncbi:fibroblast growth factor receptor substrate 3-like [Ylistrum balloti]|uniref:fibroblast growth factor receptor substrate 3-like n=1 Tax=Ylistrum balloti TaxID=509963 RepID=UPI002905B3DC|nr:fibroblast growth factor receptor substrate 3-like [Ylistrum balloti]